MQKRILLSLVLMIVILASYGQQLPLYECGIVNVYDANGNRKIREYHCNDPLDSNPYPTKIIKDNSKTENPAVNEIKTFQPIDALYPNPTTGKFYVTFNSELKNAKVLLMDINGKIIQQSIGNGFKLSFDLSNMASGVYMMRVETERGVISKKVIKQ